MLIIRKQLTTGFGATFAELTIHGLSHFMLVAAGADRIYRSLATMGDGGFFIPISKDVVDIFQLEDRAMIYYETLSFLAYAIEETKLKWYEEPGFIGLVGFIAESIGIVLIFMSLGTLTAAISQGVEATIRYLVKVYLVKLLIQKSLEVIVDVLGLEASLILAAAMAAIALYYGDDVDIAGLINSDDLLKLATISFDAINTNVADEMLKLELETEDYFKSAEEIQDRIDDANDLLDSGTEIDLYAFTNTSGYTDYNETPEDFYNRSIHLTNPGVLSLNTIENYVSGALRLPEAPTN